MTSLVASTCTTCRCNFALLSAPWWCPSALRSARWSRSSSSSNTLCPCQRGRPPLPLTRSTSGTFQCCLLSLSSRQRQKDFCAHGTAERRGTGSQWERKRSESNSRCVPQQRRWRQPWLAALSLSLRSFTISPVESEARNRRKDHIQSPGVSVVEEKQPESYILI